MGAEPEPLSEGRWPTLAVGLAAAVGLALLVHSAFESSATYDEVTYLRVAAHWWRTGEQSEITRMGSPLTFWKLQQAPVLWWLDRSGRASWVDDPLGRQAELLPAVRVGGLWVWLVALGLTAAWARALYGPRAMACAAWLFALSPNLLAHGALATMEAPLVAASAAVFLLFWKFLMGGSRWWFAGSAVACGLAFACKFTAAAFPALLGAAWWFDAVRGGRGPVRALWRVVPGMAGFVALAALADVVVTGGATLPLSVTADGPHPSLVGRFGPRLGRTVALAIETPLPQDLVGFVSQLRHQRSGGSSYLLGVRRSHGWWYYYLVALAVKVPPAFALLLAARLRPWRRGPKDGMLPLVVGLFLVVTAIGSSRNYGLRYLLPMSPLAIVWVSALAERAGWPRRIVVGGLIGMAVSVASCHPHELTYFNALGGGPLGGRHVLADSNLDWGQGLKGLARLQREQPEYRDLTLYYFGDTEPAHYGVVGRCFVIDAIGGRPGVPDRLEASTRFVAISASLQWGPWGPPAYFRELDGLTPVAYTDETTIAVYLWPPVRAQDSPRPAGPTKGSQDSLSRP